MSRFSAGVRTAGAGSTTLPVASIYAPSSGSVIIRQIEVWNTTDVSVAVAVRRLTTRGTVGAAITVLQHDPASVPALATPFNTHTAGPTISAGSIEAVMLGAQIGSGVILTYGDAGLRIPAGTANGIGIIPATGTGQILDIVFVWDE